MPTMNVRCGHCGNLLVLDETLSGPSVPVAPDTAPSAGDTAHIQTSPPPITPSPNSLSSDSQGGFEVPASAEQETEFKSFVEDGAEAALPSELFASSIRRRRVDRGMWSGIFIALVLIPLISYSILATIALVILLSRPQPRDPLEFLPDREGDLKGAKHQKQGAVIYDRVLPERELPNKLIIALGQTIQLGDVEVLPQKVELCRVTFRQGNFAPEPGSDDSLVLHLLLRNLSQDVVFSPTDPFFDRSWKGPFSGKKPYTFLDIGNHRLWGGPLPWKPGQPPEERITIEGQQYKTLQPGEQLATFVCTDPDDHVGRLLANYQGTLLWRIQVRRGLVQVGEREYPATGVIGVRFHATDINVDDHQARAVRLDREACLCVPPCFR
jgi:hypothetical protein